MVQDQVQHILSILCSRSEQVSSNASHTIYLLSTRQQAATASDLFTMLGFEVKLYEENDGAKFYFSTPSFDPPTLADKLQVATAYAEALKRIQASMQDFCAVTGDTVDGFSVNLMNNHDNSKKIAIAIHPKKANIYIGQPDETAVPSVKSAPPPVQPQPRPKKPAKDSFLQSGPSLAKTHLMEEGPNKGKEKGALGRWLYTHIFRHFVTNTTDILILIVFLMGLSAIFVTSKAFLCSDFASEAKNIPWYCDREQIRNKLKNEDPLPEIIIPGQ